MYIALEGVVGTWKTTQAKKLHEHFQKTYPEREVILVREPGGTEIAETIRNVVQAKLFTEAMHPLTNAYLYASARAQLLPTLVKPVLDKAGIVVADRTFCSSLAYQGHAQGLGLERVWEINKEAVQDTLPDIVLFMDFDIEAGMARTFDKEGDKRENEKVSFFEKVYEWYEKLFNFEPTKKIMRRVDASGSIEKVFERLLGTITSEHKQNLEIDEFNSVGLRKIDTEMVK